MDASSRINDHLHHVFLKMKAGTINCTDLPPDFKDTLYESWLLEFEFAKHVFSLCKPFDASKDDTDDENFYMEREWRVLGNVQFTLKDVYRVVLPSAFAERLRHDVPDYFGQVTFPE
jgi:abortive phage resistance protein AbiGi (putative antitoxin)